MVALAAIPTASRPLAQAFTACATVPRLSYAPWDVGWAGVVLCVLVAVAGVGCVGLLGTVLRWTADDPAPLRPLWMVLIVAGFLASAAGLYLALANQVHARAISTWLTQASAACISAMSKSPNFYTTSLISSVQLGTIAIVCIALGIGGAAIERRHARPRVK